MRKLLKLYIQTTPMVTVVLAAILGILIGYLLPTHSPLESPTSEEREIGAGYQFISPLLACKDSSSTNLPTGQLLEMRDTMTTYIKKKMTDGSLNDASVYFREFNLGGDFSINPTTTFDPGSLLKVPLVMSVYKHAEQNQGFLDQKVTFEGGALNTEPHYPPLVAIQPGVTYTVQQLIDAAMMYSDNNAAILLSQLVSTGELNASYAQLGIQVPQIGQDYQITSIMYGSFYRVLFNATYLNHDDSEHILKILSKSTFHSGLVAGLPVGTIVAHKFGEHANADGSSPELQDCGIVYTKGPPYLICVMTQGKDFDTLASIIATLSKIAYSYEAP